MARANSGATDNCRILSQRRASSLSGIEFVTTTSDNDDSSMRFTAAPERNACVAHAATLIGYEIQGLARHALAFSGRRLARLYARARRGIEGVLGAALAALGVKLLAAS